MEKLENLDGADDIVHSWTDKALYKMAEKIIKSLEVVNDAAEKRIALIITLNSSSPRLEDEKQLLQMVVIHHARLPQSTS